MKGRLRLIHWNAKEAEKRGRQLSDRGYFVDCDVPRDFRFMGPLRESPPQAVIIDLSRAPARGRDVALMIRQSPRTRHIPILFMGGTDPKRSEIRRQVPDALYRDWEDVHETLATLFKAGLSVFSEPHTLFEVYADRTLSQKLGIKKGERISVIDAPLGFQGTLAPLPEDVEWSHGLTETADLVLLFQQDQKQLSEWLDVLSTLASAPRVWICWPKKKSPVRSNLSASVVRELARSHGMAEYKVCSVDEVWTGKLFRHKGRS